MALTALSGEETVFNWELVSFSEDSWARPASDRQAGAGSAREGLAAASALGQTTPSWAPIVDGGCNGSESGEGEHSAALPPHQRSESATSLSLCRLSYSSYF